MEKLNLLLNMVIIAYILVKEFGNITKSIKKTSKNIKKYITAVKKQLIIRSIKKEQEEEYDEEFSQRCYAVARGEICFDKHSFMNDIAEDTIVDCNGLSEEDAESPDFLLATCIAVGKDGYEEVIDFDLRGDSAAPLDFSMFGGTRDQHYDLDIIKSLAGERRHTASYYAFEETVFNLRKQGKVFDDYVLVTKVTLGQIKAALNGQPVVFDDDIFDEREKDSLVEADAVIIDVEEVDCKEVETTEDESKYLIESAAVTTEETKDDITLILEEIEAGVLNKEFLQTMLNLHLNNVEKVFYAEGDVI